MHERKVCFLVLCGLKEVATFSKGMDVSAFDTPFEVWKTYTLRISAILSSHFWPLRRRKQIFSPFNATRPAQWVTLTNRLGTLQEAGLRSALS